MNGVDLFVEHVHLSAPLTMFLEHGASDTWFVGVPLCCNDYNDFFPPNFRGCLGALSLGVPSISVHGALTIPGLLGGNFIVCHWLVTSCIGAFSYFFSGVYESYTMRKFLNFDDVYDALAFDAEVLYLIPHILQ